MKKVFSKEYMIENRGCYEEEQVIDLFFRESNNDITIDDILNSEIPIEHKAWFVFRKVDLKNDDKIKLTIGTAKVVLPIFEKEYPTDNRPRMAIEASEKYLKGEITRDDLLAAESAAYAAAYTSAYTAFAAHYATCATIHAADANDYTAAYATDTVRTAYYAAEYSDKEHNTNYTSQLLDCLKSFIQNLK
jgi:hypothetical protein